MNTATQLPEAFLRRLRLILPSDAVYHEVITSFLMPKLVSFRINRLKVNPQAVMTGLKGAGIRATAFDYWPHMFHCPAENRAMLLSHPFAENGLIYIQNPSSLLAALLLAPMPGETVLDLAAAPGGKTLILAELMENTGQISAVEAVKPRFFKLRHILELHGAKNVKTYLQDGKTVGFKCQGRFDRTLLDAPCSSEARFSIQEPASWSHWSEKKIQELARKQKQLLFSAIQATKPGGIIVYCTCSFAPEENEMVVNHVLKKLPDGIGLLPVELPIANLQRGLTHWNDKEMSPELVKTARILPDNVYNAMYLAVFIKGQFSRAP
ncbi:MAG: RsmB/NOP family class I SAM-dependent RNA methyltransferase [Deltaproteobacteria bacterium]|nr:RsmB/NOP family class I SAM-dependent RNA methyltransferase [Deltaproteobacteria bacterium]